MTRHHDFPVLSDPYAHEGDRSERNDGRRAIDKQRAVQHYSDQQRIAELEKLADAVDDMLREVSWFVSREPDLSSHDTASGRSWGEILNDDLEGVRRALTKLEPQS